MAQPGGDDRKPADPLNPAAPTAPKAPPPEELEMYEGRLISEIVLRRPEKVEKKGDPVTFGPLPSSTDQLARNQLRSRVGGAYQQSIVTSDISNLNRIGRFASVENRVQLQDDGSVKLIFTLGEQPIVQDVQSTGNRQISDQDIAKEVDVLVGTPVDRYQLDNAARRIEDLYRKRGYYLAQVTIDEKELTESGIVLFKIREGERTRVSDIRFEGNTSFLPRELRTAIKTTEAFLFFEKGPVDDDVLANDVASLVRFYTDRGYLDVRVDRVIRPSPNGQEAIVTFVVDEGPVYTLRSVQLFYPEGSRTFPSLEAAQKEAAADEQVLPVGVNQFSVYRYGVYTPEQAIGLMSIKPGDVYSVDKLNKSLDEFGDAYGKMGYIDARIDKRELRDPNKPEVDLLILINEGPRVRTGEVIVQGNELTKQNVIRRQVQVKPERPLDKTAVRDTEKRLRALGLFDRTPQNDVKVTVQDPDALEPEKRDVLVRVEETNTGSLQFGAALSSDSGVVGRIALTQRNFDIADTPDTFSEFTAGRAFRGAGQTFQIEALPGSDVQTYSLSLSDPYFLETNYTASGSVFYRDRDYDEFDEERYGTRMAFGRRFGSRWQATVPVRIESINLSNIEPDAPVDVFAVEDQNILTSIGLAFSRNTYDDPIRPGKGSKIEFGIEQVGVLGGDFDYTIFRGEHQAYFTIREDFLGRKTVLSLTTRLSYSPQGQDAVPVYERFYMGGQTFRGFRYRTISPKGIRNDTKTVGDDPVGGTYLFFFGPEVKQPIFSVGIGEGSREIEVALAGFVDTGTVLEEPGFDSYRVSAGFGIRLYVPQLSPAPLAFDFGFPIVKEYGDRERVFSFTVDLPFQ